MINKAIILGNLGADPEMRESKAGMAIANLRIATTSRAKKDGEWADFTEWHSVTCFGKTAENVGRFCSKGKQVYVEGRIQTRKWEDKEGNNRYSTEVVADIIKFLGGKPQGSEKRESGGYDAPF